MGGPEPATQLSFATDSDEDLLAYMAMKTDDPGSARAAGSEFFCRHRDFVFKVLKKRGLARRLGGEDLLEDLVLDTFATAYASAGNYRPCGSDDPVGHRRAARAWLMGIAKNKILMALQPGPSVVAGVSLDDEPILQVRVPVPDSDDADDAALGPRAAWTRTVKRLIGEALDQLTDRERDVVLTSLEFYDPAAKHQRLPNAESQALARQLNTTTANIRKLRERALGKIRSHVEEGLSGWQEGKR